MEIVKLIGADVLPDDQKLVIETARVIRVGFLQQNAFHAEDTFVPLEKQKQMMQHHSASLHKQARRLISARRADFLHSCKLGFSTSWLK